MQEQRKHEYSSWLLERMATGDVIRLRLGSSNIGRHPSCTITIPDSNYVSRQHAEIRVSENDKVEITDLNSVNGVYVNKICYHFKDTAAVELKPMDRIGIGVSVDIELDPMHPVFLLKYMPIRRASSNFVVAPISHDDVLTQPIQPKMDSRSGAIVTGNIVIKQEKSTCTANVLSKPVVNKPKNRLMAGTTITISDDDDNDEDNKVTNNSKLQKAECSTIKGIDNTVGNRNSPSVSAVCSRTTPESPTIAKAKLADNAVIVNKSPCGSDVSTKTIEFKCGTKENIRPTSSTPGNPTTANIKHTDAPLGAIKSPCGSDVSTRTIEFECGSKANASALPSPSTVLTMPNNPSNSKSIDAGASMHVPMISNVKRELVRSVSAEIQNIFGEADEMLLESVKEINPYVYKDMSSNPLKSAGQKPLEDDQDIILISDEENDESNLRTSASKDKILSETTNKIQSPNIFESSSDSLNEDANKTNTSSKSTSASPKPPEERAEEHLEDESSDIMFSQMLIDEIKDEIAEEEDDTPVSEGEDCDPSVSAIGIRIKSEPVDVVDNVQGTSNLTSDSSCWIISDEEDYDAELESKVSGWTNKLFSQNPSHLNMSQVFEVEDDLDVDDNDGLEDFGNDDDFSANDFYNRQLDDPAKIVDDVVAALASDPVKTEIHEDDEKIMDQEPINKGDSSIKKDEQKQKLELSLSNLDTIDEGQDIEGKKLRKENFIKADERNLSTHKRSTSSEHEIIEKGPSGSKEATKQKRDEVEPKKKVYLPPTVIDAPQLPKHKGKLRGVSANKSSSSSTSKKLEKLREEIKASNYARDLKRKWMEKPNDAKRREKERNRLIKESRNKRLKELASKHSKDPETKAVKKRKLSTEEECDAKKAKVKNTAVSRGAFLAEEIPKERSKYKIPKHSKHTSSTKSKEGQQAKDKNVETQDNKEEKTSSSNSKETLKAKENRTQTKEGTKTASIDAFAQILSRPDELLIKRQNPGTAARSKSTDASAEHATSVKSSAASAEPRKDAVASRAQRTTNKITFASMQRNFIDTRKNQEMLEQISNAKRSCLTNIAVRDSNVARLKKKVRFNDEPVIHYIERKNGATKKVNQKDALPQSTYNERRQKVRSAYAIVENTDHIISLILSWSNEWLVSRNAEVDAASNVLVPMPNRFSTIDQYKSIVFPLMRLEFISMLEREYRQRKAKTFIVTLDNVTDYKGRIMIVTKGKARSCETKCELVLLSWAKISTFAYVSAKHTRPAGTYTSIVFEILSKKICIGQMYSVKEINVRPVVDNVRVEFGAFNAIYQLESTPLVGKILNPLELLKCKPQPKRKISYKGFDKLNERQLQVLLSTYAKAIEPIPSVTLIQGPPGTGKSCVITNLVLQLLYGDDVRYLDQKVLICAQSNAAVDVIAEKLFNVSQKMRPDIMFRLIRYGILNRISAKVQPASLQKIIERNQIRKLRSTFKDFKIGSNEDLKSHLKNEIKSLELSIEAMKLRNIIDTVEEEELHEKQRQLQLMRNIVNGTMRQEDERSLYTNYLCNANVICSTLSGCVKLAQYINYFDVCIIDEATQCTEPWTLLPLKFGINALVLVGDTQQLPATVLSKKAFDFGLGTSLFTRIQRCIENEIKNTNASDKNQGALSNNVMFTLQTQYRMHPEICKWPNAYFYKNELLNGEKTLLYKTPIKPYSILNLQYTQNEKCVNGQIINDLEVKFVAKLVKALDAYIPMNYNTYGVITPYAQQKARLEKALIDEGLPNVMVNTIDSYQGMERDVIILSNARTSGIGFLSHYQRLNVAITRPKKCLILCGNFKNLESAPTWKTLLKNARERNLFYEISANCLDDIHRHVIDKIKITANKSV